MLLQLKFHKWNTLAIVMPNKVNQLFYKRLRGKLMRMDEEESKLMDIPFLRDADVKPNTCNYA